MNDQNSNTLFDVETIRNDFPILSRTVNGKPLIYLDNAATSQTPQQVIDVIVDYYSNYNSNIHDFFIILNIAMGGNLGGNIDPNFTQDIMEIDYVRVYQ